MPYNYQEALKCDKEKFNVFFRKMLSDGVFLPPSQYETNFLSLAHSEDDIDKTIQLIKEPEMNRPFRIGTRGSKLALAQANLVKDLLAKKAYMPS